MLYSSTFTVNRTSFFIYYLSSTMADVDEDEFHFPSQLLVHIELKENDGAQDILKELKNPINSMDSSGCTLLHYAAKHSNNEIVEYLIDLGAKIDVQNHQGQTPLLLAVESHDVYNLVDGNWKTIVTLIDAKADINIRDNRGKSPLSDILARRFSRLLELLFQILNEECSGNSEKIIKRLIEADCSVYAALYLNNAEVTRLLLDRGCKLEPPYSIAHESVFLASIHMNHLENVRALLDHDTDPNYEYPSQATPMMAYSRVQNPDPEILQLLLDRGADPTMILVENHPERGRMQMYGVLRSCKLESALVLLRSNVDLNARDSDSNTALHYVVQNVFLRDFHDFEGKNFDANARNDQGLTPILVNTNTHLNALKFLIKNGADPNATCRKGITLLMRMSRVDCMRKIWQLSGWEFEEEQIIEYLLQHGADPQMVSQTGRTVFNNARPFRRVYPVESVIAHLAMLEACDTAIKPFILEQINKSKPYDETMEMYRRQMKKMKKMKIWKSVTLRELLIGKEGRIKRYLRDDGFVLKISRLSNKYTTMSYYCYALRERISRILLSIRLEEKFADTMSKITGIEFEGYRVVLDKIFSYLSERDLLNFCQIM